MNESQSQIMEENGKRYRMLQVGETIERGDYFRFGPKSKIERMQSSLHGFIVGIATDSFMPQGYYWRECK